jgi:hypothetical protein
LAINARLTWFLVKFVGKIFYKGFQLNTFAIKFDRFSFMIVSLWTSSMKCSSKAQGSQVTPWSGYQTHLDLPNTMRGYVINSRDGLSDALLSSLLDPLEGPSMENCEKLELGGALNFQH